MGLFLTHFQLLFQLFHVFSLFFLALLFYIIFLLELHLLLAQLPGQFLIFQDLIQDLLSVGNLVQSVGEIVHVGQVLRGRFLFLGLYIGVYILLCV